ASVSFVVLVEMRLCDPSYSNSRGWPDAIAFSKQQQQQQQQQQQHTQNQKLKPKLVAPKLLNVIHRLVWSSV
ncbi:MAG: hypothetical protein N6V41_01045, partial [Candidatus Portiera aleyrodidarum]|nr:hypothetical protein [Candidatus Portiera aleyrodidarum]